MAEALLHRRRVELMLALPLDKLDHLAREQRLRQIALEPIALEP